MASQLAFKSRIASTSSLAKIFNAQEMIASSHIVKAREVALGAKPYSDAIFDALLSLVTHTQISHPIFKKNDKDNPNVAVLAITADRGMAGAYTSSIIRETEGLLNRLDQAGKTPKLYICGRRGISYYKYRNREIEHTWEGDSDKPGVDRAQDVADVLLGDYMKKADDGGVSELYIVFTEFINIVSQKVRIIRMLPVQLIDADSATTNGVAGPELQVGTEDKAKNPQSFEEAEQQQRSADDVPPLYSFEPSVDEVLDAVLPKYIMSRIHECLLTSAASETASRQNAMHTATDNANNLIDTLTRQLNASRQAQITQELSEIIGSADALNKEK